MKQKEYQRLPGFGQRRQGLFLVAFRSNCRLWLGKDHLLSVDRTYYSEDYKRFFFRDIQGFILRKTDIGLAVNWILTPLALLCVVGDIFASDPVGLAFSWIFTVVFLVFLSWNVILGPTCVCWIKTAVQTEELPSLGRLRRARKVIARLRPLIAEAQGGLLDPQEIPQRLAGMSAAPDSSASPVIGTN